METSDVACSKQSCPGQGTWNPVFVLTREGDGKHISGAIPSIGVCESHKISSRLEDFLSSEGWDRMSKFLTAAGKGTFVKKATRLEWRRSKNPDVLPF